MRFLELSNRRPVKWTYIIAMSAYKYHHIKIHSVLGPNNTANLNMLCMILYIWKCTLVLIAPQVQARQVLFVPLSLWFSTKPLRSSFLWKQTSPKESRICMRMPILCANHHKKSAWISTVWLDDIFHHTFEYERQISVLTYFTEDWIP